MKKQFKPVPDVEELKYHGTKDKPDIKIFVSHRIDLDSTVIDDPIYIPVRCGAIFDDRKDVNLLGDDTGDNISEKRFTYNELTVMYWAWKNIKADYYGLCHYRRMLSFSKNQYYSKNKWQCVEAGAITAKSIEKFGLNEKSIRSMINKYDADIILPDLFDISEINCNPSFTHRTRYEVFLGKKFSHDNIILLLDAIEECCPEYSKVAESYFNGSKAYFCNCFVMKHDIFHAYCKWLFNILFYLENKIDFTGLSMNKSRILGFFSEDLLAIYFMKDLKENCRNKKELEIVYFKDTTTKDVVKPVFKHNSINIALCSSNEYTINIGVLIKSIISNSNEKYNYDIIIFHTDISKENENLLLSLIEGKSNFSIRFTDISNEISDRQFKVWGHIKKYTAYRLAIPDTLINYNKVIYLDGDIVVNHDIADLYNTNIDDYLIAAVPDIRANSWLNLENNQIIKYISDVLKLPDNHTYFNAGVVVYNLKRFRDECSSEYMLDLCAEHGWQYVDQDVLNIVCAGNTLYLPMKWNVMISADNLSTEENAPLSMYQEYISARKAPYIVHYAGDFLPVKVPTVDFYWLYWKYARFTPYYEILLNRMIDNKIKNAMIIQPINIAQSDNRTAARKAGDFFLPMGTRRRKIFKKILPKGSLRWALSKQIYYVFAPQYRRSIKEDLR